MTTTISTPSSRVTSQIQPLSSPNKRGSSSNKQSLIKKRDERKHDIKKTKVPLVNIITLIESSNNVNNNVLNNLNNMKSLLNLSYSSNVQTKLLMLHTTDIRLCLDDIYNAMKLTDSSSNELYTPYYNNLTRLNNLYDGLLLLLSQYGNISLSQYINMFKFNSHNIQQLVINNDNIDKPVNTQHSEDSV